MTMRKTGTYTGLIGVGLAMRMAVQAVTAEGVTPPDPSPMPAPTAGSVGSRGAKGEHLAVSGDAPQTYLLQGAGLSANRRRLQNEDHALYPAFTNLLRQAEAALQNGPFTVTDKTLPPPSGDLHDYMSFSRYWWPDPDQPDGLPYIRRDGETNPDSQGAASDRPRIGALCDAVETLALAYYFVGDERYAEHAARLIRTWFLDPRTRMNPHLRFAQGVPGREPGRKSGILDGRLFSKVLDGVALLEGSSALHAEEERALQEWFQQYLHWLRTHKNARDESASRNNHGTYFDVQIAHVALFVGERDFARTVLQSAVDKRIRAQIGTDGSQAEELARTRPLFYSLFNLEAMVSLARLGEHVGLDLWHAADSRLRAGVDFVAPFADPSRAWPHPTISEVNRFQLLPILLPAALAYREPAYRTLVDRLPKDELSIRREWLLYP